MKKYYMTTPLYYVNDVPHIGHAYTTIMADVIKRYKQLRGFDVFLLTGTDEHGQKIEKAAQKLGITPKALADQVVKRFQDLWVALSIHFDKFIRTTDDYHVAGVKKIFNKVKDMGDIYPGEYIGYYCISCENFIAVADRENEIEKKNCPDCGKPTETVKERCYFFRLSRYQKPLLQYYQENPRFVVPQSRMNEVISFVKMGLKDLSITRSTVKWGIPVPGDESQTIYVWFDALSNYINAVNYHLEDETFAKHWPADLHIMGKDILKFHAVYWPAFLMAADLPLPRQELIHGWWLKDEKKMSKSVGNVLDPYLLLKYFNADAIRYFLMREASIGVDGNFSHQGFINRINTDLSNDWGNLVSRTLGMINKYFANQLPAEASYGPGEEMIKRRYLEMEEKVLSLFDGFQFNRGLENIFEFINSLNKYIVEAQPWNLSHGEENRKKLAGILKTLVRSFISISQLLSPITPHTSTKVYQIFGLKPEKLGWQNLGETFPANQEIESLYPRVDLNDFFTESQTKEKKMEEKKIEGDGLISFNDFKKVQMVVAKVINAEKVKDADKLIQMQVDTGTDQRILVAGIAPYYQPSDLLNKKIIVVKNLQPAKIRGILSQGMILAASGPDRRPYIPIIPEETPVGAVLL